MCDACPCLPCRDRDDDAFDFGWDEELPDPSDEALLCSRRPAPFFIRAPRTHRPGGRL